MQLPIELQDIATSKNIWNATVVTTFNWVTLCKDLKDVAQKITNNTLK